MEALCSDLMWHIKMARSVCGSMGSLLSAVEAEFACHVELFLKFMEKFMHNVTVLISLHMHVMSLKGLFSFVEDLILINGCVTLIYLEVFGIGSAC